MKEITKIDMNKYIVIKKEDLEKCFSPFTEKYIESIPFNFVLDEIQKQREAEGKAQNKYLVLNLDDEIDILSIKHIGVALQLCGKTKVKVNEVAVPLINAILKAKDDDSKS